MKQEPRMREIVLKSSLRKIRRPMTYPSGYEAYVTEQFANAICRAYDPHSDYFTRSAKENFEGEVNGDSYIFGFDLDENENEEVVISHILPGSPAWRSGELNKGDVIISLRWAGQDEMDLEGADAEDILALFDDQNHKDIQLGVRKADGTKKLVWLEKQKLEVEENFVRSYVLDAGDMKVGYIVLPGFYEESESKNGKNCANDVAREVVKLKKENISSLILDMRNNGGGSMIEAMELAGIFIDEGTLAFAKYNTGKPMGIRDPNRGTIYDGPMVVMVNKASASASEMVADALQDYNRALIVGSPTYGKATMQVILPLDTNVDMEKYSDAIMNKGTEFVKVTLGRFYRVTGGTHQLRGVQPDIYLPDLTEYAGYGESYNRYALKPDSVKRATYFKPLPALPVADLSAQSGERIKSSEAFKVIRRYGDFVTKANKASKEAIPLEYNEYMNFSKQYRKDAAALSKEYEKIYQPGVYKARHLAADADRVKMEHNKADEIKTAIENIDKDIYIQECFSIITNYLKPTKK
jgi:carboxyl-terminal processing protease